jgi:transposase
MSLRPQPPLPPVPGGTARIARAALRRGNPYVLLRDRLGSVFTDADFADLYPALGQPAYAPWRLALVTPLQFREGLSGRQAADAVRGRIDWKYLLALELGDPGFDRSVLCEFRGRLLRHGATERLLARVLGAAREAGLLSRRGRQRTDSTHVLAAIRALSRLELVAETLRAALNAVAAAAPGWLRAVAPADRHERYGRRVEGARLPVRWSPDFGQADRLGSPVRSSPVRRTDPDGGQAEAVHGGVQGEGGAGGAAGRTDGVAAGGEARHPPDHGRRVEAPGHGRPRFGVLR